MSALLVTGAGGLVGSEAVLHFSDLGYDVVGLDNDMRSYFFGPEASTRWRSRQLERECAGYSHHDVDIRDEEAVDRLFERFGTDIAAVIHTASQPSHDWAAREPMTDFTINANGTLVLLECTRRHCPEASFIFTSTNKVYGDRPNDLPLVEEETRWEIEEGHPYGLGIDESMSIDACVHSLFGASKVAADVLVQEYGRNFGMPTACFRAGCITGPAHSGATLHGFLAYLVKCIVIGEPYTVIGHKGKQVRDNIHSHDLVSAFHCFMKAPRCGEVYNIGGGRFSNCSMLEAISIGQDLVGRELAWSYRETARVGDHIWWISDVSRFERHYPEWRFEYGLDDIMRGLCEANAERWA